MVDTIWSTVMQTIHDRYNLLQLNILCNVPYAKFQERKSYSYRYKVFESKKGVYQVEIPDSGIKYTVVLKDNMCTCGNFFQYRRPCSYAIAACRYELKDLYDHFDSAYLVRKYHKTYKVAMPLMSILALKADSNIKLPVLVKKRRRPKTKRIRKNS